MVEIQNDHYCGVDLIEKRIVAANWIRKEMGRNKTIIIPYTATISSATDALKVIISDTGTAAAVDRQ